MENVKKCTKCGRELPLDQFYVRRYKNGNTGRRHLCRSCGSAAAARWQGDNPQKVKAIRVRWRNDNIDKSRASCSRWRKDNPEYGGEWRKNNSERDKVNAAKYDRERRASDSNYKLRRNVRAAMNSALRDNAKAGHTIELLGCSVEYLRAYLEMHFQSGMSWDNYGNNGWHIDHIIPLSYFDFSDPEQQKRAWRYTNLQPLWAKENMSKGAKVIERQLVLL